MVVTFEISSGQSWLGSVIEYSPPLLELQYFFAISSIRKSSLGSRFGTASSPWPNIGYPSPNLTLRGADVSRYRLYERRLVRLTPRSQLAGLGHDYRLQTRIHLSYPTQPIFFADRPGSCNNNVLWDNLSACIGIGFDTLGSKLLYLIIDRAARWLLKSSHLKTAQPYTHQKACEMELCFYDETCRRA